MKVATPKQMKDIDQHAINIFGIPGLVLMENAALRVVDEACRMAGPLPSKNIVLLAGKGNNGGDAFAVARHLFNKGASIVVYILGEKKEFTKDASVNLAILENMGVCLIELTDESQLNHLKQNIIGANLLIDGLFGTGIRGEVMGLPKEVITLVNLWAKKVLAIDIPSGIHGETGEVLGVSIKANKTVTFGLPKVGILIHDGCEYAGEVIVADIGIPAKAVESVEIKNHTIEEEDVVKILPTRKENSNKGDYGKVFIISGSSGMTGAGCLAAEAALRCGSGLAYLGVPKSLSTVYNTVIPEAITIPLKDHGKGSLSRECMDQICDTMEGIKAIALGPGLSVNEDIAEIVYRVIEDAKAPIILDADALNVIAKDVAVLRKLKVPCIITPHPGEMARLTGLTVKHIQQNRIKIASDFAAKWNVITILKGSKTIIATPDGWVYINQTGNSGMATAGMGDVLTGILVSLVGQSMNMLEAAIAGVYLHGLTGDNIANQKGKHGLIARDLIRELSYTMKSLYEKELIHNKEGS